MKKARIGWATCSFWEWIRLPVCFKCQEPGYLAARCTEAETKGRRCYKCGSAEHLSRECKEEKARCYRCDQEGHAATSMTCPLNATMLQGRRLTRTEDVREQQKSKETDPETKEAPPETPEALLNSQESPSRGIRERTRGEEEDMEVQETQETHEDTETPPSNAGEEGGAWQIARKHRKKTRSPEKQK